MFVSLCLAARKAADSDVACFACAIFAVPCEGGEEEAVYDADCVNTVPVKRLVELVTGVPGLAGKPKLFFKPVTFHLSLFSRNVGDQRREILILNYI